MEIIIQTINSVVSWYFFYGRPGDTGQRADSRGLAASLNLER